jgi:DNA-directed RNA polymerase subunit alpha
MIRSIPTPQIQIVSSKGNVARLEIGPLEIGHGSMIGNALRRVLLSSLPSAAVTSFRIEGVQHEFQDIPHVKEDVTDIALNLKRLRLRLLVDYPVDIHVEAQGEGVLTAADIATKASSVVKIVNPELPIATRDNEHAHLKMHITIGQGRGYVHATPTKDLPIGVILIDAYYSPVQKVCFFVRRDRQAEFLTLEITTDGTITPNDALWKSADILACQMRIFTQYNPLPESDEREYPMLSTIRIPDEIYDIPLEKIRLSKRVYNSLTRGG